MTDRPGNDQPPPGWEASSSYLVVTFGDQHDPSTWSWLPVQTGIRDEIAYDVEARRRGWPGLTEGGVRPSWRYTAWHALHDRGDYPGTFSDFAQQACLVTPMDRPADAEQVGPTQPGATPE
jgi:hypothetical protein